MEQRAGCDITSGTDWLLTILRLHLAGRPLVFHFAIIGDGSMSQMKLPTEVQNPSYGIFVKTL